MTAAELTSEFAAPPPGPHSAVWPAGVPHTLDVPDESLWLGLERRAQQEPDAVGLHFLGRGFTWRELHADALHLAGALQALGVAAGDRVLLFMQNCPQFVVAFHAVLRAGAVVVPVNPMNKADELGHYLTDPEARVAIASGDIAGELLKASHGLPAAQQLQHLVCLDIADALPAEPDTGIWPDAWKPWLTQRHDTPDGGTTTCHRWADLLSQAAAPTPLQARGSDLAVLPYTSGTTGAPKGCIHPHRTLLHNAMSAAPWLGLGSGCVQLVVVPLFHITGLVMGLLAAVRHGAAIVLLPRWDRRVAAQAIAAHGVTHWPNIPTMVMDLLAWPDLPPTSLASLRYIGGGGAAMPEAVATRLREQFGLEYLEGYGLTETAAPTHTNPRGAARRQCLGIPYIGTEARVIDPTTLQPLPTGEVGEIIVRGPQVFHGYWRAPQATADAFMELDGQRFFRTGDLGRVDEAGFYYLADRLKRMINASGFKVWPAEVEALLHHHPAVQQACVIALRDAYRGESVKAVVVLKPDWRGRVDASAMTAWAREHMAAYKVPREWSFVDALPMSASGKLLWRVVQAQQDAGAPPQR